MGHQGYATRRTFAQRQLSGHKGSLLGHLDIELTERCNNACMHCYINLPAHDAGAARRELRLSEWQDILRQAAGLGALSIRLTGGEPLLHPDFPEIYLSARRLGMSVMLFTNGRLITPELADLFARVPPREKIELSVYGMHAESYDTVACAPGAFVQFRRGLELLLERQIPFAVKSVLLPQNRAEIDEFEAWTATVLGIDEEPPYVASLDLRTRRDSPARNRLIRALRFSPQEGVALVARRGEAYRGGAARFLTESAGPKGDRLFTCGAGEGGCVDPYGIYQMCMLLRHPDTIYDLRRGALHEARTVVFPRLRELRATDCSYLCRCARCFLKGFCDQCPGKSWSEYGTLDTPVEYLCQVAHARAIYLGLLAASERAWEVSDGPQRAQRLANTYA